MNQQQQQNVKIKSVISMYMGHFRGRCKCADPESFDRGGPKISIVFALVIVFYREERGSYHLGKSATIRESNHDLGVCKE